MNFNFFTKSKDKKEPAGVENPGIINRTVETSPPRLDILRDASEKQGADVLDMSVDEFHNAQEGIAGHAATAAEQMAVNEPKIRLEIKLKLIDREHFSAMAEKAKQVKMFGSKAVGFIAGTAGAVGYKTLAGWGLRTAVKRSFDMGAMGSGAVAGAVAGGTWEGGKAFLQERRRVAEQRAAIARELEAIAGDREELANFTGSKRVKKIIELAGNVEDKLFKNDRAWELYKQNRELGVDKKKIGMSFAKGAAVGALGGAAGGALVEFCWPDAAHAAGSPGSSHAAEELAKAKANIAAANTLEVNRPVTAGLRKHIWETAKQWLETHHATAIDNEHINELARAMAKQANVEITGDHVAGGVTSGHEHVAKGLQDIALPKNFVFNHMEQYNEIVTSAGGVPESATAQINLAPPADLAPGSPAPHVDMQEFNSNREKIAASVFALLSVGTGSGLLLARWKKRRGESKEVGQPGLKGKKTDTRPVKVVAPTSNPAPHARNITRKVAGGGVAAGITIGLNIDRSGGHRVEEPAAVSTVADKPARLDLQPETVRAEGKEWQSVDRAVGFVEAAESCVRKGEIEEAENNIVSALAELGVISTALKADNADLKVAAEALYRRIDAVRDSISVTTQETEPRKVFGPEWKNTEEELEKRKESLNRNLGEVVDILFQQVDSLNTGNIAEYERLAALLEQALQRYDDDYLAVLDLTIPESLAVELKNNHVEVGKFKQLVQNKYNEKIRERESGDEISGNVISVPDTTVVAPGNFQPVTDSTREHIVTGGAGLVGDDGQDFDIAAIEQEMNSEQGGMDVERGIRLHRAQMGIMEKSAEAAGNSLASSNIGQFETELARIEEYRDTVAFLTLGVEGSVRDELNRDLARLTEITNHLKSLLAQANETALSVRNEHVSNADSAHEPAAKTESVNEALAENREFFSEVECNKNLWALRRAVASMDLYLGKGDADKFEENLKLAQSAIDFLEDNRPNSGNPNTYKDSWYQKNGDEISKLKEELASLVENNTKKRQKTPRTATVSKPNLDTMKPYEVVRQVQQEYGVSLEGVDRQKWQDIMRPLGQHKGQLSAAVDSGNLEMYNAVKIQEEFVKIKNFKNWRDKEDISPLEKIFGILEKKKGAEVDALRDEIRSLLPENIYQFILRKLKQKKKSNFSK